MRSDLQENQTLDGTIPILDPCDGCKICPPIGISEYHDGNCFRADPWETRQVRQTDTHGGLRIRLSVATTADIGALLAAPEVFPEETPFLEDLLKKLAGPHTMSYPYVCLAKFEGRIIGKLFLDPNPNNAVRRNLNAAVIDSVSSSLENRGVADKLIEFAEDVAVRNNVRWVEIGVIKDNARPLHSYIRRGFREYALYLRKEFEIHYNIEREHTLLCPRYGESAVVVYKDLQTKVSDFDVDEFYESLVSGLPA